MTIVVVLFESTAGSSVRKGLLRLAGTLAGAAAGIAIYYFVLLCNGLSLADHPQARLGQRRGPAGPPATGAGSQGALPLPFRVAGRPSRAAACRSLF